MFFIKKVNQIPLAILAIHLMINAVVLQTPHNYEAEVGIFWHITDIHFDYGNHTRGGNRNGQCHISEGIYYDYNGKYGHSLCDVPLKLLDLTLSDMNHISPDPNFIIWTGGNLPQIRNGEPDWNTVFSVLKLITALMKVKFPNVMILPAIGNHDVADAQDLQIHSNKSPIYDNYLKKGGWDLIINQRSWQATFRIGGYYCAEIEPGKKVISLNTVLWYKKTSPIRRSSDPCGQFNWLYEELKKAFQAGDKVYIIGHIPPGFHVKAKLGQFAEEFYHAEYLQIYLDIITKFSKVIVTQIFGHLHVDSFQLHYYKGIAHGHALLGPSVTPGRTDKDHNMSFPTNPTMRLYYYKKSDFGLLNYHQYFLNLSDANSLKTGAPSYQLLYSFVESYNVPDISTNSLTLLHENLKYSRSYFDRFCNYAYVAKSFSTCNSYGKSVHLCAIGNVRSEDYKNCMRHLLMKNPIWNENNVMRKGVAEVHNHHMKDSSVSPGTFLILVFLFSSYFGLIICICYHKISADVKDLHEPFYSIATLRAQYDDA